MSIPQISPIEQIFPDLKAKYFIQVVEKFSRYGIFDGINSALHESLAVYDSNFKV